MSKKIKIESIESILLQIDEMFKNTPHVEDLYSVFKIPKASGYRVICAPCQELKNIQRRIYREILFPYYLITASKNKMIHGFIPYRGILTNADQHSYNLQPLSGITYYKTNTMENWEAYRSSKSSDISCKRIRENYLQHNDDIHTWNLFDVTESANSLVPARPYKELLFKADIKSAFSNTKTVWIEALFGNVLNDFFEYGEKRDRITKAFAKVCTLWGGLPQGAPTSPILLNLILFQVDQKIEHKFCKKPQLNGLGVPMIFCEDGRFPLKNTLTSYSCVYTRYADDLALSFRIGCGNSKQYPRISKTRIENELGRILSVVELTLNRKKTKLFTKKHGFSITGVTIGGAAPTISRKKFKNIKAKMNNFIWFYFSDGYEEAEKLSSKFNSISGDLSFVAGIDLVKAGSLYRYFLRRTTQVCIKTCKQERVQELKNMIRGFRKVGKRVLDSYKLIIESEIRKKVFSELRPQRGILPESYKVPF